MSRGWPRLIILLVIGGFFAFRWWTLGGGFHAVASITYVLAALAGLLKLPLPSAKHQTLILNVGISLVFLDLVFAQIEWSVLLDALAAVNYWMLVPSFALVVVSLVLRTWRRSGECLLAQPFAPPTSASAPIWCYQRELASSYGPM
jgi:hypothetical protein